ncbi:peptide-methionine (R)-S-oxide reductase MsrB [uncultured Cetobacterium sp.]|uniref:peptide-methionine (R)-S-oxide reductase MsrB n=1 Tax=uncultured Cetobacterium sp. TaxID=527638 RepID=UPI0026362A6D|nr:peptide-methionine (R)-S-oxide reductase MsrB [uncultured Cetobacterium sp.]
MKKIYFFLFALSTITLYSKSEIIYFKHNKNKIQLNCILNEKEGRTMKISKDAWKEKDYKIPSKEILKENLTPLQYRVTQEDGTERPFCNEYWDNTEEGIYVDIISGEPLFSSTHKYHSGTGWPSFYKPISQKHITTKEDKKLFTTRTEVRSAVAGTHLGHVFDDGPLPTEQRYCLNSSALKFIPKNEMKKDGYEEYLYLFEEDNN